MPGKRYWLDIATVSVLIALGVMAGGVNFIVGSGDELTFANVLFSLIYIAAWAAWGCTSLTRVKSTHPTRIFYTVWFSTSALAAFSLLVISLTDSSSFMSSGAGNAFAVILLIVSSPMYGICLFGSSGYIANDIVMLLASVTLLFLPQITLRIRKRTVNSRI